MHLYYSSAVCVRPVLNSVMKDAHKEKDTHTAYNITLYVHLMKIDPAYVVFIDDCVQNC